MKLLQERMLNSLKEEGKKFKRFTSSFLSISILGVVLTAAPINAIFASSSDAAVATPVSVKLDVTSPRLVDSNIKTNTIVLGESAVDKAAREKADAEAKAKADAAAAAIAKQKADALAKMNVPDPADFNTLYQQAGAAYGVDPKILKAIHIVETGASGSTGLANHSGSGASGPMQFLPSTFRAHAVDGNGDGKTDISNVSDAIYTAAAYLKACGYPNLKQALWGYNPSVSYFNKVTRIADSVTL